ncbi:MAG: S1 RNA-binding domain-containing protein, partial [Polaribacter sp.]|nr:S1 RNA-binding domain-containing protein [Polaribacter sp.]
PSDFTSVGDKLEVQVLELDVEGRKLNLGHKQTQDNPWDAHEATYAIDSLHEGTISDKNDKGATVAFADGVEGFAPTRFLDKEDGGKLEKGDTAQFKVLEFSKEYRRVVVSHTSIFKAEEKKNVKAAAKKSAEAEKTTLGDISGLADLKKKMEGK